MSDEYVNQIVSAIQHRHGMTPAAASAVEGEMASLVEQLDQERARTARLRELVAEAEKMSGATLVWLGGEFPNHPPREDLRFLESDLRVLEKDARAALADTPSDWLAEHDKRVRAEERERCGKAGDEYLSAVGPIPGQEMSEDFRRGIEKGVAACRRALASAIRALGGEGAK